MKVYMWNLVTTILFENRNCYSCIYETILGIATIEENVYAY